MTMATLTRRMCHTNCIHCRYAGATRPEPAPVCRPSGGVAGPYGPLLDARSRDDRLPVLCWCERHVVRVDRATVLAGRTESCGAHGCRPPT
jgi:hypothetical protein